MTTEKKPQTIEEIHAEIDALGFGFDDVAPSDRGVAFTDEEKALFDRDDERTRPARQTATALAIEKRRVANAARKAGAN